MARGPDGKGGGAGFSLSDQLFNAQSLGDLAAEYACLPGFDPQAYLDKALPGLIGRGLLERLDWLADCLEPQLPRDFPAMAEALVAAMPPPLDPNKSDDDFGRFIHALPGILAVRHGIEAHPGLALDLIYEATKRFSMEFYIRPFLNLWPDLTLERLERWSMDDNYHVRRLVSEGTRPRLPWAKKITLPPEIPLRFLDRLYGDKTRYVTRSVANHMNDLTRIIPERVVTHLQCWREAGQQEEGELDWICRHALRSAVKRGERSALDFLGYHQGDLNAQVTLQDDEPRIGGTLRFEVTLQGAQALPVMVDYRLRFHRPKGTGEKVFKLKTTKLTPGRPVTLSKVHPLKGNASTFRLYPGPHELILQVNGMDVARAAFTLRE